MQMHMQYVQILLLITIRNNSYLIPANTDKSSNSPLPSEWTFQYICGTHFHEQEQGFLSNNQTTPLNIHYSPRLWWLLTMYLALMEYEKQELL